MQPYVLDHSDKEHIAYIESLKPIQKYDVQKEEGESDESDSDVDKKDFIFRKGAKNLSRRDKAALIAAGIKGILQKSVQEDRKIEELDLEMERNTKLKASIITVQFLAFKPS